MDFLDAIYIVLIATLTSLQAVMKKSYGRRGGSVFIFCTLSVFCACTFFLARQGFSLNFSEQVIPYSIAFAASYFVATVFSNLAIRSGSMSLTSLATSYSLLIPTFYGLTVDGNTVTPYFYVGLALLFVSLLFINFPEKGMHVSVKWAVFALLALLGNGVCSTVQAVSTVTFGGEYDDGFMVVSLTIVLVALLAVSIFTERGQIVSSLRRGLPFMIVCGVANGGVNMLVMIAAKTLDKSLMFPMISAGGIILTWLVACLIYREHLSKKQNFGVVLGILSVILLNL